MTVIGDARRLPFPDGVAQCVVTSPPYYGLRNYNVNGQIGLEQTPAAYVAELVAVFREVWRVLRDDGVAWLNIGDSYASATKGSGGGWALDPKNYVSQSAAYGARRFSHDVKDKDLLGIPWRVAFALRSDGAASPDTMRAVEQVKYSLLADYDAWDAVPDKTRATIEALEREFDDANKGGWYLRSDCIWHKPNPMPESVTDRPTKAHEYVFLLAKSARYFYDADAISETSIGVKELPRRHGNSETVSGPGGGYRVGPTNGQRNARTVWTIATRPYSGAHFATMPPALAQKCILAGTSERGACPKCGAAWVRETEHTRTRIQPHTNKSTQSQKSGLNTNGPRPPAVTITTGWRPACDCNAGEPVPCVVLDPFSGAGTTERVAIENGRRFIGTELNPKYIALRSERVAEVPVRML